MAFSLLCLLIMLSRKKIVIVLMYAIGNPNYLYNKSRAKFEEVRILCAFLLVKRDFFKHYSKQILSGKEDDVELSNATSGLSICLRN